MKTIGFTVEMDTKIIRQNIIETPVFLYSGVIGEQEKEQIVSYLKNAECIFGITLSLFDEGCFIAPYKILSDGEWLWPSHYFYYLSKNGFSNMSHDFLTHIKSKHYNVAPLSIEKKKEVTLYFWGNIILNL